MRGSDGQTYPFLLKGREDLHLDERVMQFLSVVNQMLNRDNNTASRSLRARNYAVIPLSTSSGLLQWVEHVVPLFSAYENNQTSALNPDGSKPKMQSPSAKFYEKIIPALKAKGITNYTSRKEWPPEILKRVFLEMVRETPSDLFAREIWCSSTSVSQWWQNTQALARSVAVSSIVGYTIGLGDRHLDNILIDYSTGEVVHIDYNVCFEKGLKLLIPEIVPFRMTHTIQRALGPNGVEGCFRIACENVLRVLRSQKETLLTLLEAFVYDPLVDWTGDFKTQHEEFKMDLAVTLNLLSTRVVEMKDNFSSNLQMLSDKLPQLANSVGAMSDLMNELHVLETTLESKIAQAENIRQSAAKIASTLVNTNTSLEGTHRKAANLAEKRMGIHSNIKHTLQQCNTQQEFHLRTIVAVLELQHVKLRVSETDSRTPNDRMSLRPLEFIASLTATPLAAQLIRQSSEMEKELSDLTAQWQVAQNTTLDFLVQYRTAILLLPYGEYHNHNVAYNWGLIWKDIDSLSNIPTETDEKSFQIIESEFEVISRALQELSPSHVSKMVIAAKQNFVNFHNHVLHLVQQHLFHSSKIEGITNRFNTVNTTFQAAKKSLVNIPSTSNSQWEAPFFFACAFHLEQFSKVLTPDNLNEFIFDVGSILSVLQEQYSHADIDTALLISHDPESWTQIMIGIGQSQSMYSVDMNQKDASTLIYIIRKIAQLLRQLLAKVFPDGAHLSIPPLAESLMKEHLQQCRLFQEASQEKDSIINMTQQIENELKEKRKELAIFCWMNEPYLTYLDSTLSNPQGFRMYIDMSFAFT